MTQTPQNYRISSSQDGSVTPLSANRLTTYGISQEGLNTPVSPSRLSAYGVSQWLNTDLDRLYVQYPQLFSKDDNLKGRLSLHSNVINENTDLRSQIAALQKENELLKLSAKRTSDEVRITTFLGDNQNFSVLLSEKTRECETWKSKFTAADAEAHRANVKVSVLTKENQHLVELTSTTKEQLSKYELLKVQLAHLQAEYNSLSQTRDQLILVNQERERKTAVLIAERERTISELSVRVGSSQTIFTDSEATRQKIASYAAENERLAGLVAEQLKTIDGLKFRITQLNQVEASLAATAEEKSRLLTTLTEKLAEIEALKARSVDYSNWEIRLRNFQGEKDQLLATLSEKLKLIDSLNLQITSLQVELSKGSDYQSRVNVLLAENERLNALLVEKVRVIDEWATRYSSLEQLYLHIKETTEQLDFIKRKYETAVSHTEKLDPRLKQSVDLKNSRVITESSPTPSPRIYYNTLSYANNQVTGK